MELDFSVPYYSFFKPESHSSFNVCIAHAVCVPNSPRGIVTETLCLQCLKCLLSGTSRGLPAPVLRIRAESLDALWLSTLILLFSGYVIRKKLENSVFVLSSKMEI